MATGICEFTYGIHNCEGSREYKILYIISIVMWSLPCIFSFSLLYWKLKYQKNSKLFIDKLFAPVEGFLLWCGINNLTRVIGCVVIYFNFFSESPVARELIYTYSWSPGFIAIYSFIAGMFQCILRMKFEQFTISPSHRTFENVINENRDGRNRSKTVWIPQGYQVTIAFWVWTFIFFSLTTIFAVMMGLNLEVHDNDGFMKHNKAFLYVNGFFYGTYLLHCSLVIIILLYHGRNLLRMLEESFMLTGIQDARDRNVPERIKSKLEHAEITFRACVIKLRTFIYSIVIFMIWFDVVLVLLAVIYERLFSALWIGFLFTAVSNLVTPICLIAILLAILKSELNPDQEETATEVAAELNEVNTYFSDTDV